jgi:hypothetical protein
MPKRERPVEAVSEIRVAPQPCGLRAVYLVETRSASEGREVNRLFSELESQLQVRQLSKGKLLSYAVQADQSDSSVLDEIEEVLKSNFAFVVTQRSFDELICRIVKELCEDTGSKVLPLPHCNICKKVEPFPSMVVSLSGEDGSEVLSRSYCASCTAEASTPNSKQFVRSLLSADERDLGPIAEAELVRHPSRKLMRFKVSK